jgi:ComF family protein
VEVCRDCEERPPAFHAARSLFHYQHTGERLVLLLKYGNGAWVLPEIRRLVEEGLPAEAYRGHRIVPVPLHTSRRRSRGYNQAEVVARALASVFPEAAVEFPLVRVRRTSSQTTLTREQRGRNVAGAFALRRGLPAVTPGPYLLVDDVLTTGATLHAAASVLRRAGATTISAFTLAHG